MWEPGASLSRRVPPLGGVPPVLPFPPSLVEKTTLPVWRIKGMGANHSQSEREEERSLKVGTF